MRRRITRVLAAVAAVENEEEKEERSCLLGRVKIEEEDGANPTRRVKKEEERLWHIRDPVRMMAICMRPLQKREEEEEAGAGEQEEGKKKTVRLTITAIVLINPGVRSTACQ